MCSQYHQFSVPSMASSELFLVQEEQKEIEFKILTIPTLDFQDESHVIASQESELLQELDTKEDNEEERKIKSNNEVPAQELIERPSLGEFKATEDDNDEGFQTPTSLDHKIPAPKQCPPAPRKPKKLQSTKRKLSPKVRQGLLLDLSKEVESMFPSPVVADIGRKIKKARMCNRE